MKKTYIPENSKPIPKEALEYYNDADSLSTFPVDESLILNDFNQSYGSLCANCLSYDTVIFNISEFKHITGASKTCEFICKKCKYLTVLYYEFW